MSTKEEPSYMMFARANVKDGLLTGTFVVRELLARIDLLEKAQQNVKELVADMEKQPHTELATVPWMASIIRAALEGK